MTIDFADPSGNSTAIRKPSLDPGSVFDVIYAEAPIRPWPAGGYTSPAQVSRFKWPHLVWADKVGLAAVIVIAVLSALACTGMLLAANTVGFSKLNHALAVWSGMAELTIALPVWLLMRGIDFAANGPAQRRAGLKPRTR